MMGSTDSGVLITDTKGKDFFVLPEKFGYEDIVIALSKCFPEAPSEIVDRVKELASAILSGTVFMPKSQETAHLLGLQVDRYRETVDCTRCTHLLHCQCR